MNQALLIIDVQQELVDGNNETKNVLNKEALLDNVNLVINKALESHALIIFVRDKDVADGKGPGFQIHQTVKVPTNAKYLIK